MTKDELQEVVLMGIDDLCNKEMSETEALLTIGFLDNLRQAAADRDQSDHFGREVDRILGQFQAKQGQTRP